MYKIFSWYVKFSDRDFSVRFSRRNYSYLQLFIIIIVFPEIERVISQSRIHSLLSKYSLPLLSLLKLRNANFTLLPYHIFWKKVTIYFIFNFFFFFCFSFYLRLLDCLFFRPYISSSSTVRVENASSSLRSSKLVLRE